MPERKSLYDQYPDYRVDAKPHGGRVTARIGDTVIAETDHALRVEESNHTPVMYFPRADVHFDAATRTDHETFCPFKGEASYWSFEVGGQTLENVAWSYETPFEQVEAITDYVAFYPDRVTLEGADAN